MSVAPIRPPKLVAIQALRGVAALAIALHHLVPDWVARGGPVLPWLRSFPLEAGVDVFFVISGFIMVYASAGLFGAPGAVRIFLGRRIGRVVPLYWLTTSVVLLILAIRPELLRSAVATPALTLASYLFIPWPRPDGLVQPVYSLGWTLNYEMLFYGLFALGLGLSRRRAVILVGALLLILVGTGYAAAALPETLRFWTAPIMLEFLLGMALGLARLEGVILPLAARSGLAGIGIGLLWLAGTDSFGLDRAFSLGIPAACLVASVGLTPGRLGEKGPASGFEHRLARASEAIGDASYAIYLLHPFVIRGLIVAFDLVGLGRVLGAPGLTVAALAATIAVGLASYRWIERPLTRMTRRGLERGG